ncbi:hypothetical protein ACDZ28_00035 (plasmid) [Paenibacillus sp. RS8]|uniref:hypothetical protein n=1 Tax=Paenibacillus sp. RS8 TaxID=3242681 RepID=UPI0035BF3EEA
MEKKEFEKKITGLRAMKQIVSGMDSNKDKDFRKQAESFKAKIPNTNKNLDWTSESEGFEEWFNGLEDEYVRLSQWNSLLKKASEIKKKENREKEELKKTPQNKEGQVTLSLRGGARPGAGRKSLGVKRKISIVLPQEDWDYIDSLVAEKKCASVAEYFRHSTGLGL